MSHYKTCSKCGFLYPVGSMSTVNSNYICQGCARPKPSEQPIESMHPSVELRHVIEERDQLKQKLLACEASGERMRSKLDEFVSVYVGCGQSAVTGVERKRFEQTKNLLRELPQTSPT